MTYAFETAYAWRQYPGHAWQLFEVSVDRDEGDLRFGRGITIPPPQETPSDTAPNGINYLGTDAIARNRRDF